MSLKEKYKELFLIGAAVNTRTIKSHAEILKNEFNSLTCENEMKYGVISRDGETYDFDDADQVVQFAEDGGFQLRMHTLLWHNQAPAIFENATRDTLLDHLKRHTHVMAERYGKKIYACDVANEVIADANSKTGNIGDMRRSHWYEIIGEDFCDQAFRFAKDAMPGAKLFYNDYNECDPVKSRRIFDFVKGMLDRGVPVDGLGLQCHWNIENPTMDEIRRAFDLYAKLDIELHITEMDVSLYPDAATPAMATPSAETLDKQTMLYEGAFKLFRDYKNIITCVTTWGVADDVTWLDHFPTRGRKNWPLLFDEGHQKKDACHKIMAF